MATNLVIDADGHCNEPDVDLAKWLPKEYAHLAPNRVTDSSGYSHLMIEGRLAGRRRWGGGADRGTVDIAGTDQTRLAVTEASALHESVHERGHDVDVEDAGGRQEGQQHSRDLAIRGCLAQAEDRVRGHRACVRRRVIHEAGSSGMTAGEAVAVRQ